MVGGMLATVLWKNLEVLNGILDIKAAAVLISALLVVSVSWWGNAAGAERTTG
jgi:hypothetical protein